MGALAQVIDLGLVVNKDKVVVSSRTVAERFERRHDNILQRIQNLDCSPEFTALNFQASEYQDATGKKNSEVLMTRDGFTFCVMGMTGKRAAEFKEKYIAAFNDMEAKLKSNRITMPTTVEGVVALLATYATTQQAEVKQVRAEGQETRAKVANVEAKVLHLDRLTSNLQNQLARTRTPTDIITRDQYAQLQAIAREVLKTAGSAVQHLYWKMLYNVEGRASRDMSPEKFDGALEKAKAFLADVRAKKGFQA